MSYSLLSSRITLFFWGGGNYGFTDHQSAFARQKCQDVVILVNFVEAAVFRDFTECMGASQKIKAYGKKQEWGEHKRKKGEGMREYWGSVVGAARRQPENHIWK